MTTGTQSHAPDDINLSTTADQSELDAFERELRGGEAPAGDTGEQPGQGKDLPQGQDPDDLDDDQDDTARVDQELRDAPDEAARDRIRAERRQGRQNQRQRQKSLIERLQRELSNLQSSHQDVTQRLARYEGDQRGAQYLSLQRQEQEALQAREQLKRVIADATVKGDGQTVAVATEKLLELTQYETAVRTARTEFEREQAQPQRRALDPKVLAHARAFMAKNPWYQGPQSDDRDSQVLAVLDRGLVAKGWNPASEAYWEELSHQAAELLPHRFGAAGDQGGGDEPYNRATPQAARRPQRRSPVADGGGDGGTQTGGGETKGYVLSADRVRALKEAGMWDDPEKRKRMIARYREQDRQAKG